LAPVEEEESLAVVQGLVLAQREEQVKVLALVVVQELAESRLVSLVLELSVWRCP